MKKLLYGMIALLLLGVAPFLVEQSNAGIYNNSGTTAEDSICFVGWNLDSSGRICLPITAASDSLYVLVFYPGGGLAFRDSMLMNNAKITLAAFEDASTAAAFSYKCAVADIDGAGLNGTYKVMWFLRDVSALNTTMGKEEAQVYTTVNFSVFADFADDSALVDGSVLAGLTGAISATTVADGTIDAGAIAADAIGSSELATDAIGAAEIAAAAITSAEATSVGTATAVTTVNGLAAGVITATSIATDAITDTKIAAGAITSSEIATDAIGAAELAVDAIGASEIAAGAIVAGTEATGFSTLTATDNIGINWADVSNPTTTLGLTNTTVGIVTTTTTLTNHNISTTQVDSILQALDYTNNTRPVARATADRVLGVDASGQVTIGAMAADVITDAATADGAFDFGGEVDTAGLGASAWAHGTKALTDKAGFLLASTGSDADTGIVAIKTKLTTIAGYSKSAQDTINAHAPHANNWGGTGSSTGLDSATTSRIVKRTVWGVGGGSSGSDSTTKAQRVTGPNDALDTLNTFTLAADLVDLIWDEDSTGHYTSPNMAFTSAQTAAGSTPPTAADIWGYSSRQLTGNYKDSVWAASARTLTALDEDGTTIDLNASAVGSVVGAVGSVTGAVGSVTGAVGSVTGAVGSVTGNVGGNVTGSVGSVASGGITATSIATDAIGAAEIAADAIGSSELATDAIGAAEIAAGAITSTEATSVGTATAVTTVNGLAANVVTAASVATGALVWGSEIDTTGSATSVWNHGTKNVGTATAVTTVNGLAANVITATAIASDAITNAKIATGALDFGSEIDTSGDESGVKTEATTGGGGATAADIWAYGTRTLTSGSVSANLYPIVQNVTTIDGPGAAGLTKYQFVVDTTSAGGSNEYGLLNTTVLIRDADDGHYYFNGIIERVNCVADQCTLQVSDSCAFAFEAGDSVWMYRLRPEYVIASLSEAAAAVASTSLEGAYADSTLGGLLKLIAEGAGAAGFDSTLFLEMLANHGWYATFDTLGLRVTRGNSYSGPVLADMLTIPDLESSVLPVDLTQVQGDTATASGLKEAFDTDAIGYGRTTYVDSAGNAGGSSSSGCPDSVGNAWTIVAWDSVNNVEITDAIVTLKSSATSTTPLAQAIAPFTFTAASATYYVATEANNVTFPLRSFAISTSRTDTINGGGLTVLTPSSPSLCAIQGVIKDLNNNYIVGAKVTFTLESALDTLHYGSAEFIPFSKTVMTNASGYFSLELMPNSLIDSNSKYIFKIEKTGVSGLPRQRRITVPASASANIDDL